MSDPKPYDLSKPEEMLRLVHEVYGYLKVSSRDGTDYPGRWHAIDALRRIEQADPAWAVTVAKVAAYMHSHLGVARGAAAAQIRVAMELGRQFDEASGPSCASCKFLVRENLSPSGYCHRHPPAWAGAGGSPQWHRVADNDWCGEHRPRAVVDE